MKSFVYGRLFPERKDDIAWENDRCAYRLYGPALQQTGEKAYGIDIWVKNTPDLVIEQRYRDNNAGSDENRRLRAAGRVAEADSVHLATSFHLDHGYGYDPYKVGPTLGCGTPARIVGDSLIMPYCFTDYEILDNGPLRFTVALTYEHGEHRLLSLDKGSHFNRMTVWYDAPADLAAGVVVHEEDPTTVVLGNDYVQYADPTDNVNVNNSQVYVAALFPNGVSETRYLAYPQPQAGATGHAVGIRRGLKAGEHYTYYFGAAWSKYDIRSQAAWQLRIDEFMHDLRHPLKIKFYSVDTSVK